MISLTWISSWSLQFLSLQRNHRRWGPSGLATPIFSLSSLEPKNLRMVILTIILDPLIALSFDHQNHLKWHKWCHVRFILTGQSGEYSSDGPVSVFVARSQGLRCTLTGRFEYKSTQTKPINPPSSSSNPIKPSPNYSKYCTKAIITSTKLLQQDQHKMIKVATRIEVWSEELGFGNKEITSNQRC